SLNRNLNGKRLEVVEQLLPQPGELPIEQPTKFELVVNLKTSRALGLTMPPQIVGRADVIQ
ncbi:MAG TPA: hypothetical protein VFT36_01710, partial [Methylomirabilota bacterium]|nr:hypothetical protein [Methylomirabilota bacterium]